MAKRKAAPSTKEESEIPTARCQPNPLPINEGCRNRIGKDEAVVSGVDTQGVPDKEASTQPNVAVRVATWALSPEATVAIADVSKEITHGYVNNGVTEVPADVSGHIHTRVVTRPVPVTPLEVGEGHEEALAFWSLLKEAGYESW